MSRRLFNTATASLVAASELADLLHKILADYTTWDDEAGNIADLVRRLDAGWAIVHSIVDDAIAADAALVAPAVEVA